MFRISRNPEHSLINVIRCDEPSYLIWKWHPPGSAAGMSSRENGIRWGSTLRVKEGEVAVFVQANPEGVTQEVKEGPFDGILETLNLPLIADRVEKHFGGQALFPAEVYFINLAEAIQVRFAVPFFDVFDSRYTNCSVPVAVRGSMTFGIRDYREFIRLHRLATFTLQQFQTEIRDFIVAKVKSLVANAPFDYDIPVLQIERLIGRINEAAADTITPMLENRFGIFITGFDVSAIEIDKTCGDYVRLRLQMNNG